MSHPRRYLVAGAALLAVAALVVVLATVRPGAGHTGADGRPGPAPPSPTGVTAPAGATRTPTAVTSAAAAATRSRGPSAPPVRRGPVPGAPWQWQLTTPVDQTVNVSTFDIDGFDNSAAVVRSLHGRGRYVICYVEVGAAEDFRPDYHRWPASVLGAGNGWPGERWVDIRRLDLIGPVIAARLDMCRAKGFDAVEPDLMDHYANTTGFPITAAQQLTFNRYVAALAHARGLAVALKNDVEQAAALVGDFDFAVNEECFAFGECASLRPFTAAGKAVLHVEYNRTTAQFCPSTRSLGFSSMRKNPALDAPRWSC